MECAFCKRTFGSVQAMNAHVGQAHRRPEQVKRQHPNGRATHKRVHSRLCDGCHKPYYRSNLVRVWVVTNPGHRIGWVRVIQRLCCTCMRAADAQQVMREINPKWRMMKPVETIATVNVKKPGGTK
jgi:hypothetical protein